MQEIVALSKKTWMLLTGLFVLVLSNQLLRPAAAGEVSRIWYELYIELNPGHVQVVEDTLWIQSVSDWARREQKRLEPIVLGVLEGNRPGTHWTRVLPVTKAIPTEKIRDALFQRIGDMRRDATQSGRALNKIEHRRIAFMMATLAEAHDPRCAAILNQLLQPGAPAGGLESYLKTLQKVGNENSIGILQVLDARGLDRSMNRLVRLTKKVIEARLKGAPVAPDAKERIRILAGKLVRAVDQRDYKAYVSLLPFGHAENMDAAEVTREIFESKEVAEIMDRLRQVLDEPLSVDVIGLGASFEFGKGHKLEVTLEIDGWKIKTMR